MYNTLPATGMVATGIFGLSTGNNLALGMAIILLGIVVYRVIKFKVKEEK